MFTTDSAILINLCNATIYLIKKNPLKCSLPKNIDSKLANITLGCNVRVFWRGKC